MNQRFQFWWYWLIVACCGVIVFSVSLLIFPDLMYQFFNTLFFSFSQTKTAFSELSSLYIKFVYGVLGAVMVGWSVSLLFIIIGPFHNKQLQAWQSITVSMLTWFILDSSFSIIVGFWQNAILNIIFLVFFLIPLAFTYQDF